MNKELRQAAHAVLLPAFADLEMSDAVKQFLENGGCAILLGESREEYVNRTMSLERQQNEKTEDFHRLVTAAKSIQPQLIVAVDQEVVGICRLQHLVPPFPEINTAKNKTSEALTTAFHRTAKVAKQLGVNCFLAPILDLVTGENPWLSGRTWSSDAAEVGHVSAAYIAGVQKAGVAATAKHFPGYPSLMHDPAISAKAVMTESLEVVTQNLQPFKKAIDAHVALVMLGPAIVEAIDTTEAASCSPKMVDLLRKTLGFDGVILSDDLDAPSILRGRTIETVAVKALQAGCDFLLLADIDDQVARVANQIEKAVLDGTLEASRLMMAASRVRRWQKTIHRMMSNRKNPNMLLATSLQVKAIRPTYCQIDNY